MDAMSQRKTIESSRGLLRSPSGKHPDFGAIFMANKITKNECFKNKLFALPHAYASFVDGVKAGMVLFLFDHENRKLHGVFEAVSDGATNIMPHAYRSSGMRFSEQVRTRPLWRCYPLSEREFSHAIQENYFAANKFNFGLSKDQVRRLLFLFQSKKVGISTKSLNPLANEVSKRHSKVLDEGKSAFCDAAMPESVCEPSMPKSVQNLPLDDKHKPYVVSIEVQSSSISDLDSEMNVLQTSSSSSVDDVLEMLSGSFVDDLGDYIPLASPDDCDHVECEITMLENTADDDSIFPRIVGITNSDCTKTEVKPGTQGLYSDTSKKRNSVFSRLKLDPKLSVRKEVEGELSVEEIMDRLQKRLKKNKCNHNNNNNNIHMRKKKGNVFSRLRYTQNPVHHHDEGPANRKRQYGEWNSHIEQSTIIRSVKPRVAETIISLTHPPLQISYQESSASRGGSVRNY